MTTEAGDMKTLGNFRKLIDWVSAEPNYNPSNALLTKEALEIMYGSALAAVEAVSAKLAPNKAAILARQEIFALLPARARQVRNYVKSLGASKATLAALETPLRKLTGMRKSARIKDDPNTPENEADQQHSASQMSYDNRTGSFAVFRAIVKGIVTYIPNEAQLKLTALDAFADDLEAKNNAVSTTFVPLSQARGLRDGLLYQNTDSVVNTAQLVKAYVSGAFGNSSHLYKQIKGLTFGKRPAK